MQVTISTLNMAVSGRPLGAIWAAYLFALDEKAATRENGGAPKALIEISDARAADHALAANLTRAASLINRMLMSTPP